MPASAAKTIRRARARVAKKIPATAAKASSSRKLMAVGNHVKRPAAAIVNKYGKPSVSGISVKCGDSTSGAETISIPVKPPASPFLTAAGRTTQLGTHIYLHPRPSFVFSSKNVGPTNTSVKSPSIAASGQRYDFAGLAPTVTKAQEDMAMSSYETNFDSALLTNLGAPNLAPSLESLETPRCTDHHMPGESALVTPSSKGCLRTSFDSMIERHILESDSTEANIDVNSTTPELADFEISNYGIKADDFLDTIDLDGLPDPEEDLLEQFHYDLSVGEGDPSSNKSVAGKLHKIIDADMNVYKEIHDRLMAYPDFNNLDDYMLGDNDISRTTLDIGPLMRKRIQLEILRKHLSVGWWKDPVPALPLHCDIVALRKTSLEHLIALSLVMYDVSHWRLLSTQNHFAASLFNEGDELLSIRYLMTSLWDRVNRFLSRDMLDLLGGVVLPSTK